MKVLWLGCYLLAAVSTAAAQDSRDLEKRVTDFTLANGLRFVILERHQAPVFSFHTQIAGGSVDDPAGQTGLANLVGRLAYKGTETVGTRNWPEERKALEAMDEAYDRMEAERNKGPRMNREEFDTLRSRWRLAVDAAGRQSDPAEYTRILTDNGATDPKAGATSTALQAGYTLPSNRLELWCVMESQRLMHPVLRDFDRERSALVEEQTKFQADPQNQVLANLLSAAFTAHPYRVPAGGWISDLPELKRSEAREFVEKHFVPGNVVIAMVGDLDPAEVRRLADKYFAPWPARPLPSRPHTVEPPQQGPRTVELGLPVQPMTAIGFKRPSYFDKDDVALDVMQTILGTGSSGLVWRELVQEKKLASAINIAATYPDGYYPNLFLFFAAPAPGQSLEQLQKGFDELLGRLRSQKMGSEVVMDATAQTQALAYQRLNSNVTMAEMLATYTSAYGDWKKLFTLIGDVSKVTEDDVLRVAQRYLNSANRTSVTTVVPGMPARATRAGGLP